MYISRIADLLSEVFDWIPSSSWTTMSPHSCRSGSMSGPLAPNHCCCCFPFVNHPLILPSLKPPRRTGTKRLFCNNDEDEDDGKTTQLCLPSISSLINADRVSGSASAMPRWQWGLNSAALVEAFVVEFRRKPSSSAVAYWAQMRPRIVSFHLLPVFQYSLIIHLAMCSMRYWRVTVCRETKFTCLPAMRSSSVLSCRGRTTLSCHERISTVAQWLRLPSLSSYPSGLWTYWLISCPQICSKKGRWFPR